MMLIGRAGAPAVLLAVLLLAACAGTSSPETGPPSAGATSAGPSSTAAESGPPSAAVPPSATPSGKPLDPVGPSAKPKTPTGALTLTGTVVAGVEANCLLLRTDSGDYLLLMSGNRAAAAVGAKVTATGTVDKDIVTTCQQGTPFVVSEIRAA